MTWLAVDDRQHGIRKTRVNVRLDREQAVTLADAIIGPPDRTGLLTRDEAVKRVASCPGNGGSPVKNLRPSR